MMKFLFKCLLLVAAFFFGVLYGTHQGDNGQANKIANIEQLVQTEQMQDHSTPIVREQESSGDAPSSNVYSALGNTVSKTITGLFRGGVTVVSSVIEHLLKDSSRNEISSN